jgi:hypothetical protein
MTSFKNSVYSNTSKGSSNKDSNSHWYHKRQEQQQDRLIKQWQQIKKKNK